MARSLIVALVVALATLALTLPSGAHTALLRASPDRDAMAGGSVDVIDLEFLDPVSQTSVTVTYNGTPVAGLTTVPDGKVITFTLNQPLVQTGRYQVDYQMISFDGDFTTGGFFFTYDPAAAQPTRIEPGGSGLSSSTTLALSVGGLAIIAIGLGIFVLRIERRRRDQLLEAGTGYDMDDRSW